MKIKRIGWYMLSVDGYRFIDMSSYATNLQDRILQVGQQDVRCMDIVHKLQRGTSTGAGAHGMDYCITMDGLVKF